MPKVEILAERVASPVCGTLYRGTRLTLAPWEAERLCRIGAARIINGDEPDEERETSKVERASEVGSADTDELVRKNARADRMVRGSVVR